MNMNKFSHMISLGICMFVASTIPAFADSVSANFESPTYAIGNINGQDGWSMAGSYDVGVVDNTSYGYTTLGSQSLRISNAITTGSFGDQTFAKPLTDAVGETDATDGSFSPGTLQRYFVMQFDIASTVPNARQPGLAISVSPDRGDGSRMSYLRFEDGTDGIDVYFDDVHGTSDPANFVETQVASGLDRTVPHTVKLTLEVKDGPSNDIVKVYIDGNLVRTGTSWENYYRYDSEASAEQSPRIVKTVIFRSAGTQVSANSGNGFLFDNITLTSSAPPLTNGSFEEGPGGSYAYLSGGSSALTGWLTTQNGVEWFDPSVYSSWGSAQDGNYVVDLAPYVYTGGGIEQSFYTQPGEWYQLNFYGSTLLAAGRDGTGEVDVWLNGTLNQSFNLSNSTAMMNWQPFTVYFNAANPTTTVEFRNNQDPYTHFAFIDAVSAAPAYPDLVVTGVTAIPSPAAVGQTVTLTATVSNNGGVPAGNFAVNIYKNLSLPPVVGQAGDGSCSVTSLAAGASTTCSVQVAYSAVGSNVAWALVDAQNTVSESNERNNTGHVGLAVMLPDLDVTKVTVPSTNVAVNQPVTISATVENTSAVDVIGGFEISLYKNLASAPGVSSVSDVNCPVSSLASMATTTCTGTVTYSAPGSYTVWAQADTLNDVAESNEANNTGHASLTVALPDLIITRVTATPTTGTAPVDVTITATVKNASSVDVIVPFRVDLYQDLASAPGVSDVSDVFCPVGGLAAATTTTCSATVTYEAAGTYQVWGQVDALNAVTETKESNNVTKGPTVRMH
jgi:CARDB/Protein of unknown function (DUF642)